jgi:predicted ester cyclase
MDKPISALMKTKYYLLMTFWILSHSLHSQQLEKNKIIARLYFEEVVNKKQLTRLNEVFAETYIVHNLLQSDGVATQTLQGQQTFLSKLIKAFPDIRYTVHDLIAEGDKVFVRTSMTGTHEEEFMGFSGSGKKIEYMSELFIFRMTDGKIVESWFQLDMHNLLKYLQPDKK